MRTWLTLYSRLRNNQRKFPRRWKSLSTSSHNSKWFATSTRMFPSVFLTSTSSLLIWPTWSPLINGPLSSTSIFISDPLRRVFLVSRIVAKTSSTSSKSISMNLSAGVFLKKTSLSSLSSSAPRSFYLTKRFVTMIFVSSWSEAPGLNLLSLFLQEHPGSPTKFGARFVNWQRPCLASKL